MHGGMQLAKTKTKRSLPPVAIEHLRLEHLLAVPGSSEARRVENINRALNRSQLVVEGKSVDATKLTILKRRGPPLAVLFDTHRIGGDELRAAQEISSAFFALSGGLLIRPQSMERRDPSYGPSDWPAAVALSVRQYQAWAKHWSLRAKRGDKTLEIIIAAIVDERPFSVIEADVGIRHGLAAKAVARGLRDYAARADPPWVDRRVAAQWKEEAEKTFAAKNST